jgi:hypothetical protein
MFVADQQTILDEVEEYLTGMRRGEDLDTVLTTVLVALVVQRHGDVAAEEDRRRCELLESFETSLRRELNRFRGRENKI